MRATWRRAGYSYQRRTSRRYSTSLKPLFGTRKAKQIIVVGDIKNDFSTVGDDEFNELYEIIQLCKRKKVELVLIKGNHDNFIDRYKEPFEDTGIRR